MSVLVYIQNFGGKLKKQNLECASYASKVAESMQCPALALVLGPIEDAELQKLSQYGISKTVKVNHENLNTRIKSSR